jgi:hypothetical protein
MYSNDANKTELKNLLEKSFDETTGFVFEIYEKYLIMHW